MQHKLEVLHFSEICLCYVCVYVCLCLHPSLWHVLVCQLWMYWANVGKGWYSTANCRERALFFASHRKLAHAPVISFIKTSTSSVHGCLWRFFCLVCTLFNQLLFVCLTTCGCDFVRFVKFCFVLNLGSFLQCCASYWSLEATTKSSLEGFFQFQDNVD